MRNITGVFALSLLVVTAGCSMHEPNSLPPPGHYEHTTSRTTPSGTDVETERTTDVTVDRYGNRRATVEESTTTDPPGLFNSRTSTSTRVVHEK